MNTIKIARTKIVQFTNYLLNKVGAELIRYPHNDLRRRIELIKHFDINKIFDVGASVGRYAMEMRELGFNGEMVSFEPLSETFKILKQKTHKDKKWSAINIALGDSDMESFINIAGNNDSSSLLEMLPAHIKNAPQASYIGKEKIKINRMDTIINDYSDDKDKIFVKIDTQGFESNVIKGATDSLLRIKGIQVEMSLVPLYSGGILFHEMIELLMSKGYKLYSLENGFSDFNSGQLLQVDGIFFR